MPGLIKTGIKYGALFGVAHEAGKVLNNKQQQQAPTPPPAQYYQQPPQTRDFSQGGADQTGYVHQTWCNGQCGRKCNGAATRDQSGYLHQGWCSGSCGQKCNGSASSSNNVRNGESTSYYQSGEPAPRYEEKK